MSDQVVCCHVKSAPIRSLPNKVSSGYARSGQGHVLSGKVKVRSGHIRSGQGQVWSCQISYAWLGLVTFS